MSRYVMPHFQGSIDSLQASQQYAKDVREELAGPARSGYAARSFGLRHTQGNQELGRFAGPSRSLRTRAADFDTIGQYCTHDASAFRVLSLPMNCSEL